MSNIPMSVYYRKTIAPCKDCPDRYAGCHSKCQKYMDWSKEEKQKLNEILNVKANEHLKKEWEIKKFVKKKLEHMR